MVHSLKRPSLDRWDSDPMLDGERALGREIQNKYGQPELDFGDGVVVRAVRGGDVYEAIRSVNAAVVEKHHPSFLFDAPQATTAERLLRRLQHVAPDTVCSVTDKYDGFKRIALPGHYVKQSRNPLTKRKWHWMAPKIDTPWHLGRLHHVPLQAGQGCVVLSPDGNLVPCYQSFVAYELGAKIGISNLFQSSLLAVDACQSGAKMTQLRVIPGNGSVVENAGQHCQLKQTHRAVITEANGTTAFTAPGSTHYIRPDMRVKVVRVAPQPGRVVTPPVRVRDGDVAFVVSYNALVTDPKAYARQSDDIDACVRGLAQRALGAHVSWVTLEELFEHLDTPAVSERELLEILEKSAEGEDQRVQFKLLCAAKELTDTSLAEAGIKLTALRLGGHFPAEEADITRARIKAASMREQQAALTEQAGYEADDVRRRHQALIEEAKGSSQVDGWKAGMISERRADRRIELAEQRAQNEHQTLQAQRLGQPWLYGMAPRWDGTGWHPSASSESPLKQVSSDA